MSPVQQSRQLKELADAILARKPPGSPLAFVHCSVEVDPVQLEKVIRQSSFGSLLLCRGASLSAPQSDYYPDLNLFASTQFLCAVELSAWGREYDKYRVDPKGPSVPPYRIKDYPGQKDWARQVDIRLWYSNGTEEACQVITLFGASGYRGLPQLSRDVIAPAYAETGYEGHNQKCPARTSARQVSEFLGIATNLFLGRSLGSPGAPELG